jgi:drug/metabolite transporter (DMT)-like permease
MPADRPLLGILLMIGFCALAPLGDAIAKLIGGTFPLVQLLLARFAVQSLLLLPFLLVAARSPTFGVEHFILLLIRTLLHIVGLGAMFLSLRYLPLADALAIAFVMPFILLLLGRFVLEEEIGPRRLGACIVGFCGTLLVIQPSFAEVGWPALLPLVVAVAFALFMVMTRMVARRIDPVGLQAISGMQATLILAAMLGFGSTGGWPAFRLVEPQLFDGAMMIALGIIGTVAHLLMTAALRFAPSATLAPMQYLEIPFATLIGWLVFRDLPDGLALTGILITMGSGLYIVFRERANFQPAPPET